MNEASHNALEERTPEELAREAQGGKELATRSFEELVARFEGPLYQFLLLRLGNREIAEELTQETFLRAWHKLEMYDPTRRFSTWLFTLGKHLAVSYARKRSSSEETQASGHWRALDRADHQGQREPREFGDPAAVAEEREEGLRLWRIASEVLKVEQRSALWLRYAEDLSIEEIARILGKRAVSVRVLLHRAREALAKHLPPSKAEDTENSELPVTAGVPLVQNTGGRP